MVMKKLEAQGLPMVMRKLEAQDLPYGHEEA